MNCSKELGRDAIDASGHERTVEAQRSFVANGNGAHLKLVLFVAERRDVDLCLDQVVDDLEFAVAKDRAFGLVAEEACVRRTRVRAAATTLVAAHGADRLAALCNVAANALIEARVLRVDIVDAKVGGRPFAIDGRERRPL